MWFETVLPRLFPCWSSYQKIIQWVEEIAVVILWKYIVQATLHIHRIHKHTSKRPTARVRLCAYLTQGSTVFLVHPSLTYSQTTSEIPQLKLHFFFNMLDSLLWFAVCNGKSTQCISSCQWFEVSREQSLLHKSASEPPGKDRSELNMTINLM